MVPHLWALCYRLGNSDVAFTGLTCAASSFQLNLID